jgi:hypothetical protein
VTVAAAAVVVVVVVVAAAARSAGCFITYPTNTYIIAVPVYHIAGFMWLWDLAKSCVGH